MANASGITHLRRIFDLAALHHVRSGSHGATDLSPAYLPVNRLEDGTLHSW